MKNEITIEFDKLIVIESLSKFDVKTGKCLVEDLKVLKLKYDNFIDIELIKIESKVEFEMNLKNIFKESIKKDEYPYIHFEMHGNKNGLGLANNEFIYWEELKPHLVAINKYTNNKLTISLGSCFGGKIFKIIQPIEPSPFRNYIGALDKIHYKQLFNFKSYFETLFKTSNINSAILELNKKVEDIEMVDLKLYNSDINFEVIWSRYEKDHLNESAIDVRVNELTDQLIKDPIFLSQFPIQMVRPTIRDFLMMKNKDQKEKFKKIFNHEN